MRDRDLEMAVEHLADMLQHSTITGPDLAGEADVILSEIDMHEDSPEDVVHDVFTEALWPGHPLGRPILGTKDRIKASTRASVRGFYRRHYVPGRMVVSVAGNVQHDKLLAMLADRMEVGKPLGARGRSNKELRTHRRAPKPSGEHALKAKKVEQAHLVLGTNGLARTDPDRFAFLIVNTVLGGGMSSRLFQEIREKRGLAYSVSTFGGAHQDCGYLGSYAAVEPKKAPDTLAAMLAEWAKLRDEPVPAEELKKAKEGRYTAWSFRGTPEWVRTGYFQASGDQAWTIAPAVRKLVRFERLNLSTDTYPASGGDIAIAEPACPNPSDPYSGSR